MAQASKHHQQALRAEQQSVTVEQDHEPTSTKPGLHSKQSTTHSQIKSTGTNRTTSRFDRASSNRASKVLLNYPLDTRDAVKHYSVAQLHQPSKVFMTKCHAELKLLLDVIRPDFHQEIKNLFQDEIYTDLHIQIGNEIIKKPFHKCIIASRAFKFYSALKEFKAPEPANAENIIVHQFQSTESGCSENEDWQSEVERKRIDEERLREALEVVSYDLPEDLLDTELLLNFLRRSYYDQDISEEESRLIQLTIGWLRANKFDLIKHNPTNKHSPDHRDSFRTIQPHFDGLSINDSKTYDLYSTELSSIEQSRMDQNDTESEDVSQATGLRDENLSGSLLPRTETFELISKSNSETPEVDLSIHGNRGDDVDGEDDRDRSVTSNEINESECSEPFTPVTRTGLKPKQFTTPVGVKSSSKKTQVITSNKNLCLTGEPAQKKQTHNLVSPSDATNAKELLPTTTIKNSSRIQGTNLEASASTPIAIKSRQIPANRSKPTPDPAKPKQTIIARAQPISLERSQSPGTALFKGSKKNFIAANKKMISQFERKIALESPQGDHGNGDSENDISDTSLLALTESFTTDDLAAQVDKFSLVNSSRLAEALSRLFIQEILTDTIVLVQHNKQINAHRCILAVRSAYFSDLISKQCLPSLTAETSTSAARQLLKLDLTDFSYPAVYFSLMHIYSGIVKVPDNVELEELTKLSHLLHVASLRQVCTHNLRMNYCHYFHKPCNSCCIGVLKTLPIAWRYDLTELYSQCLQWIGSHFAQIFCLEEFSNLKPTDLIEECYKETLGQLTPDSVIQKTIECQKLLKSLPRVKWTESVICLVGRQLEDFCHYVADNYEKILQSESFLNLGKSCWECEVLEENLLAAMSHLKPDSGCRTLMQLDKIECSIEPYCNEPSGVSDTFANLVSKMRKYCERYLLKDAAAVVHCNSWRQMNPTLQKRIKDQALLSTDFDEPTKNLAAKPRLPSMARQQQTIRSSPSPQPTNSGHNSGSEARSPSNRSTPDSRIRSPNTTYLPPPRNKQAAARHMKVLK